MTWTLRGFSRHRGFTLVELLVVSAVVSVIAALLLPALIAARAAPKSSVCISNLKQLYAACAMYASDYNGYLPPYQNQIGVSVYAGPGQPYYKVPDKAEELVQSLEPYVKTADIWFCPSDYLARSDSTEGMLRHRFSSYKTDVFLGAWPVHGALSIEGTLRSPDGLSENTDRPFLKDELWDYFPNDRNGTRPLYTHNGSFNFAFFDGHVKSYPWVGGLW
jgi:prepilin-type N-terminal cleavage/methylation domain-containing protein/prepilin-type processing-associated H-X9-DG protein